MNDDNDDIVSAIYNLINDMAEQHTERMKAHQEAMGILTEIRNQLISTEMNNERQINAVETISAAVNGLEARFNPPQEVDDWPD